MNGVKGKRGGKEFQGRREGRRIWGAKLKLIGRWRKGGRERREKGRMLD